MDKDSFVCTDLNKGLYFFEGSRQNPKSDAHFDVYEPRSGKVVAKCGIADEGMVNSLCNKANSAQKQWKNVPAFERGRILMKTARLLRENVELLAKLETLANGKNIKEAREDIESCAETFDFYGGILPTVSNGEYFVLNDKERIAYTRPEPYGVVGAIGAWNYPMQTCVWKTAPALAAGNAVVYKPSPFAPASPVVLGEILSEAGLPNGVFNVVQGDGSTGQYLCTNPFVKKVTFTGSVSTGQAIQRACAQNGIKPVTLELGGKSAFIVFEDADIKGAVAGAILANFLNQGEVCTNATRVFVHDDVYDEFLKELFKELEGIKVGDPLDDENNVGAMINEGHMKKVLGMVENAVKEGAKLVRGGNRLQPKGVENGFYMDPAVLLNVTDNMTIAKEEIFGPVMLILRFNSEEEVVERANSTSFGLACGLQTKCMKRAHRMASALVAGTVFVNTYNDTHVHVPFGGAKASGHGRENSVECLKSFLQTKAVYVNVGDEVDHHLH